MYLLITSTKIKTRILLFRQSKCILLGSCDCCSKNSFSGFCSYWVTFNSFFSGQKMRKSQSNELGHRMDALISSISSLQHEAEQCHEVKWPRDNLPRHYRFIAWWSLFKVSLYRLKLICTLRFENCISNGSIWS